MNDDPTTPLVAVEKKEQQKSNKPLTGFQLHPENINRAGYIEKEWTMKALIRESLEEEDETGIPYKIIITRKLRAKGAKGDMAAIKEIIDRMDGKSKESIDLNATITVPHVRVDTEETK